MVSQLPLLQPERPLPQGAAHELCQRHQLEVMGPVQLQLQGVGDEAAAHLAARSLRELCSVPGDAQAPAWPPLPTPSACKAHRV